MKSWEWGALEKILVRTSLRGGGLRSALWFVFLFFFNQWNHSGSFPFRKDTSDCSEQANGPSQMEALSLESASREAYFSRVETFTISLGCWKIHLGILGKGARGIVEPIPGLAQTSQNSALSLRGVQRLLELFQGNAECLSTLWGKSLFLKSWLFQNPASS